MRTPTTKGRKGGLRDTSAKDLLAVVLKVVLERTKLDPDDAAAGGEECVVNPGLDCGVEKIRLIEQRTTYNRLSV